MKDITTNVTYFGTVGKRNTDNTLALAHARAEELGIDQVVVASNTGATALIAVKIFKTERLVVVTHSTGFRDVGVQELKTEIKDKLSLVPNVTILTTTHAFGGVGRAVRIKLGTYQVDEIIAFTLRTFGQGTKVCCELAIMAADAGLIDMNKELIAIGGTGSGADTAIVLKPAHAQNYLDMKILEIICKPRYF